MIQIGSFVALSAQFLRDTAQHTGPAGDLRGEVVGFSDAIPHLAEVQWAGVAEVKLVNVNNLVECKRIGVEASLARPGFIQIYKGLS